MEKYKSNLLDMASKMDALTGSCGEITKLADAVIQEKNREATISLLKKISTIDDKTYPRDILKIAYALKQSLINFYGHETLSEICSNDSSQKEDSKPLAELLDELNSLIGLENVKSKVNDLIIYQKVQKLRRENNLHTSKSTLHMAFTGNPGTGKTTVARIVGRIYKQLGLLSKGQFIEVSRTDLIAGYQGQTALKVKKVIDKAKGGVLFIDEAYSITENDHSDSYGRECLTELTKALEDYRDDLVVIVAGYTEPMKLFFESNPGLKSRFNTFIEFSDYSADELEEILISICKNNDYILSDDARKKIEHSLKEKIEHKDEHFANGRLARNIFDDLIMNHARRIVNIPTPSREQLSTITAVDYTEPA